ncbi:DNA cytosine methyltransferase [Bacillus suaedaesalsae]|uniref:Cytosine-specific methyltransferase n=1 Tax=Bacillus suaedaesalsae TaxID=2810349 RepID=A0ABS2DET6_9BACI|nr:DNA cytosine methyltransferase [Bacillus suaedaesalsae]MBM6616987.1 DNA cytosine methyltransferase [Bacillus suaedaesalsae]
MLRIASVFSGIGSVEYALKRLNIPHEIIFACDNGDIELKDIDEHGLRNKIMNTKDPKEKKKLVDDLYAASRKTNFVKQTYFENYPITEDKWHNDVKFIDGTQYKGKVDLFVGGSPCQSFSIMGYQKGLEDTRGTLFYDFARLVDQIEPKVFIYENVQGLTKHDKGNTWEVVSGVFHSLGYKIYDKVLDSADFGIPQKRRRIFVIGFKNDNAEFEFPNPVDLPFTLQDFLIDSTKEGNFTLDDAGSIQLTKEPEVVHDKYYLSEKVLAHVMSTGTKGYYTKPEIDLKIARPLLSTMHKMHRAGVDNYVTTNNKVRKLTPRECFRLMGYDDTYKIVVSDTQAYRQAGNSIVVDVFIHLLKSINKAEKLF